MNKSEFLMLTYSPVEIYIMVLKRQIKQFPKHYWYQTDSLIYASKITKYMFSNVLNWCNVEIKENLTKDTFHKNKLGGMLKTLFNSCYFRALENAMPNTFKKWEFKNSSVGNDYWTIETGIEAVKWLVEEKLKLEPGSVPKNIIKQTFIDNNLGSMLAYLFRNSPYLAINSAYPNLYTYKQFNKNRRREYKKKVV